MTHPRPHLLLAARRAVLLLARLGLAMGLSTGSPLFTRAAETVAPNAPTVAASTHLETTVPAPTATAAAATNSPESTDTAVNTNSPASVTNAPAIEATDASRASSSGDRPRSRRRSEDSAGSAAAGVEYSSFRIVTERNIFNANRSGRSSRPRNEPKRQPRIDAFGLVGTMSSPKGLLAFFDGSSGDYRKALPIGGKLAGYEIVRIDNSQVELLAGAQKITLPIGAQLRREDEGEWKLSETTETFASSSSSGAGRSDSGGSSGNSGASSAPAGEMSDVLKRLMQKREQELK